MSSGEQALYVALTVAALAAVAAFAWYWISLGVFEVPFLIATALLAFHLGSWFGRWLLLWRMRRPTPVPPVEGFKVAVVTTFVPDAESIGMLAQSLRAMRAMDYPHDTWVLDEGDSAEVIALCRKLGVRHYSRKHRDQFQTNEGRFAKGTKYGNYNAWLAEIGATQYQILAAFDPDHVPEKYYLTRVLGFFRDPIVAYVQAPQIYYNQDASFIARGAAEESYAYYSTHLMASYGMGQTILVGSHTTQRISALMEVGGFAAHDADDLLITLRYRASRWEGIYLPEMLALGMTPVDWDGYLRQQIRWVRSVIDIKLHVLPKMMGDLSLPDRFLSLFHGAYYLRAFTIPIAYAVLAGLLFTGRSPAYLGVIPLAWLAALMAILATVGLFRRRYFLDPVREGGLHWRAVLLQFAKWPYQCIAAWRAVRRTDAPYTVTLKLPSPGSPWLVMSPHGVVAIIMALALAVALQLRIPRTDPVVLGAAAIVLTSAVLVFSEFWSVPNSWDETLYLRRRAELSDILGPPQEYQEETPPPRIGLV
ncbi:MAG TPA: glycosyltransferase family 2 protein [Gemmatimonadales bacterium]|nr:glycosyltransferase family 2 protein [Gemmatimonadales bacterium]